MDIIFIRELRIQTIIGVHPWERQTRRTLLLDLELGADVRPAAATDRLDDTLDYQAVARRGGGRGGSANSPPPAISGWWKPWASGSPN